MRAVVGETLAAVPVPQLDEGPGFYSPSVIVVVTGVLTIVAVILFVFNSLASDGLAKLGISPLPRVLISAGVMITIGAVFILVAVHDQNAYKERIASHVAESRQARLSTLSAIEQYFGVDLEDYGLPLEQDAWAWPMDLVHPDGREETCLVGTDTGFYEIRCGSDEWDEAVPLAPVDSEVGP